MSNLVTVDREEIEGECESECRPKCSSSFLVQRIAESLSSEESDYFEITGITISHSN